LFLGKTVFYGHSIPGKTKMLSLLPGMWRNEDGQVCYEMPQVDLS